MTSPYPTNGAIADLAHAQHGLVGYAHPFDTEPLDDAVLSNALPADVAHGKVDYYEAVGFDDHRVTNAIWYRLLNCGFRLPAGAGTDAMTNFASLRGPVGMNRVFIDTGGAVTPDALRAALTQGRTFATNSALLGFAVDGRNPGATIALDAPGRATYHAAVRSLVPLQHVEVVYNGKVVATHRLANSAAGTRGWSADVEGTLELDRGGWLLLRAWSETADPHVLDIYPFATTSPVYLTVGGQAARSAEDAAYFVRWLDRVIDATQARADFASADEKTTTMAELRDARAIYAAMR